MKYNFDEIIDRKNSICKKWDPDFYRPLFNGKEDLLPLWVADMDFKVAPEILKSLSKIIEHGVLGYTFTNDDYFNSIIFWYKKRKNIELKKEWIVFTAGVVPAIGYAIQSFTEVQDKVLIQPPVYGPFKMITENNERVVVTNPLINNNGHYEVDFVDFEKKIVDNNIKLFILCNPHNPVGRAWTKAEIIKMADICLKHNVLVISDEIHSDLIYKDSIFTSFLSLEKKYLDNVVVCTAPSKTFNLAGTQTSNLIIPNEDLMKKYQKTLAKFRIEFPNTFGMEALKAGYLYGEEWLDELLDYLDENRKFIATYLKENIPNAKYNLPEGTYLAWIDFNDVLPNKNMEEFFENKARIAIDYGTWFGKEGRGFIRLNFACPRAILKEALDRIKSAL